MVLVSVDGHGNNFLVLSDLVNKYFWNSLTSSAIVSFDIYEFKFPLLPPALSSPESTDIHLSNFYCVSFPKCQGFCIIGAWHTVFQRCGCQERFRFQLSSPGDGLRENIMERRPIAQLS